MRLRIALTLNLLCMVAAAFVLAIPMKGQEVLQPFTGADVQITGLPDDWTHHHLTFSDPGTEQEALDKGTYSEWVKVVNDPRYLMQQLKRRAQAQGPAAEEVARFEEMAQAQSDIATNPPGRVRRDWSMDMGFGAKVGAGMYPAKFSFNGTANCGSATSPDFVVYNTSLTGSSTQASIVAYYNLYSGCSGQKPSVYWAFNTGGTILTSAVFSVTGSQLAFVQTPSSGNAQLVLLKWGATPAGRNVTGSVTSGLTGFTVSSGTPLSNLDVGAAISGGGIPAGDTIATVTSTTAGTLFTAANGSHSNETLAITADAGGPDAPTAVTAMNYPTCTAPCMTTITFSGTSRSDTISSPFYDYSSDTLYVGDASGGLHKFHPAFNGTAGTPPAEIGSPWPVAVSTTALSGPVYDVTSTRVFVGDASGFLYAVSATGAVTKSFQVATGPGIVDGPLVDSSAGRVYAFVSSDMNASATQSACNGASQGPLACNGVIQFPAAFTASTQYTESVVGVHTNVSIYIGAFDNLYWSTGTGNLYVNGINDNSGTSFPKLARIPINTSGFTTNACQGGTTLPPNSASQQCAINIDNPMTSAAATPAPVTEIYNNPTDWIFSSVSGSSSLSPSGCPAGNACVYSWNVTSALGSGAAPSAGLIAPGGTSGIVIDNTSATTGASQIYYSTMSNGSCATSGGTGGCAVQASQAALQ